MNEFYAICCVLSIFKLEDKAHTVNYLNKSKPKTIPLSA